MRRAEDQAGEAPVVETGAPLDTAAALAGSVAHDLGNMLTVVLGNAELLVEALADRPELAELAEFASLVLAAAQRGTELTGRLDRFARRIALAAAPVDVAAELARFARRLSATLPPAVRLETRAERHLCVSLPASALVAALNELVANALAAMGETGGRLAISAARDGSTGRIRITVEDDGEGMNAELLRRQGELRFSSGIAGHRTGLGLALALRVARAADGRLSMRSVPGLGTCVVLELPPSPVVPCREATPA